MLVSQLLLIYMEAYAVMLINAHCSSWKKKRIKYKIKSDTFQSLGGLGANLEEKEPAEINLYKKNMQNDVTSLFMDHLTAA